MIWFVAPIVTLAFCVWGLADCRARGFALESLERRIAHNRRMIRENTERLARAEGTYVRFLHGKPTLIGGWEAA